MLLFSSPFDSRNQTHTKRCTMLLFQTYFKSQIENFRREKATLTVNTIFSQDMRMDPTTVFSCSCFGGRLLFSPPLSLRKGAKLLLVILNSTCFRFILTDTVRIMSRRSGLLKYYKRLKTPAIK